MVIYSAKSTGKVFHLPHCSIIRRIHKPYRKQFATPEEARLAGYRMCGCCSPVGKKLRKNQMDVNRFCHENGTSCWLEDDQLYICTPRSEWKIIVSGKKHNLFLYHKNTHEKPEKLPGIVPGYHAQAVRRKTIIAYMEYIVQHDTFWSQQAKNSRKKANSCLCNDSWICFEI